MNKIPTIFERDWNGDKCVINMLVVDFPFDEAKATEKLDGTNVRVTIRNKTLVRLEKRRNPSKLQKAQGIEEPWYVDADENDPGDKYLWEAARNRSYGQDGEWSGEVVGKNIQGNTLNLNNNVLCLFSLGEAPVLSNVPTDYEELKKYLSETQSSFGTGLIEGIVWHHPDGRMAKIKGKDFKADNR